MTTVEAAGALDLAKLEAFVFRAVDEVGATLNAALVVMGDKLGLYRAMAGAGPLDPAEIAQPGRRLGALHARVAERPGRRRLRRVRPGDRALHAAARAGDGADRRDEPGVHRRASSRSRSAPSLDSPRITEAARTGAGVGWHDHVHDVHDGCERFFRPGYNANLVSAWLPALDGVVEKLEQGASVADVGCGHGSSTILMAQAYPNSTFVGFDYHEDGDRDRPPAGRGGRRRRPRPRSRSRPRPVTAARATTS